ncbi:MAG: hypothetical protein HWQ41_24560 [Nostoc sp. NOS(2021)]|uniref:hypothetical protein n=1 Tax=Nostoc sp. NOS(2021) TaxID=2815407 RepID=UPI0025F608C5|nr:hypothetical protein [Nostoc sp. NOS(2021)]MBN3898328.1 hypothetical protein [Nostoc sp. NOS(2021)]
MPIVFNVVDAEDKEHYLNYEEIEETKVADEGLRNDDYLDAKCFFVLLKNGDILLLEMARQNQVSKNFLYRLLMPGE